ncbi:DUF2271 domain-containing protein [Neptunicella sp. SCSIO 80796]|uniref:DUF2271 domain-containing protein n=1 Tax=Neptunicella plasticusilytica TaxID=3117012 RepID=UPI003A4E5C5A
MKIPKNISLVLLLGIAAASMSAVADQPGYTAHYDNVLGTSLDVRIIGVSDDKAEQALDKTLHEIKRLENILSTWQSDSQISQLNHSKQAQGLAEELIQVVSLCEQWRESSQHAFSCRMGNLEQLWQQAEQLQQVPDRVAVRYQARDIDRQTLKVDTELQGIDLGEHIALAPSGLAKGYIIDKASDYLRQLLPEMQGLKLDIGGDAYYWGHSAASSSWNVAIATPNRLNDDNSGQINSMSVQLASKAIASSGHNSRFFEIQRRRFSHILTPKDGWPMDNAPSAVVIANDATTADAVATALSTQPAMQGLDWVNSLDGVEALIMLADGTNISSDHWVQYLSLDNQQTASTQLPTLRIDYQIPDIKTLEYHKPYMALWITDNHNKPIKNLLVLGENSRWARENSRWWRKVGRRNPDLLDGLARPTRRPGKYNLLWNGLDDAGYPLSGSEYQLHIEAAREEGGHDYQSINFNLDNATLDLNLPAQGEIGAVALHLIR